MLTTLTIPSMTCEHMATPSRTSALTALRSGTSLASRGWAVVVPTTVTYEGTGVSAFRARFAAMPLATVQLGIDAVANAKVGIRSWSPPV